MLNNFQNDVKSFITKNFSKALIEEEAYKKKIERIKEGIDEFKHAELPDERLKEIREKHDLPENYLEIVSISFHEKDKTKRKELQEFNSHVILLLRRAELPEAERNYERAKEDVAFIQKIMDATK